MNDRTVHRLEPADPDDRIGRRRHARVALNVRARLVTRAGSVPVILQDISASGARVRLSRPMRGASGRLEWLNFAEPVRVIRQEGHHCALAFTTPLQAAAVDQTTDFAQLALLREGCSGVVVVTASGGSPG